MVTTIFPPGIAAQAAEVWSSTILAFGRPVELRPNDESAPIACKAFCKRPKILGLFDRTEQSYDQTRYMVMIRAQDAPAGVAKFDRVRWDSIDHVVLSFTDIELGSGVYGYRLLVKG